MPVKKTAENRAAARESLAKKNFDKPQRTKAGRFPKGVSGNPGGTRGGVKALAYRIQKETADGMEIVDLLLQCMRGQFDAEHLNAGMLTDAEKFKARQWAIEKVFERGFGKPKETVEVISGFEDGGDATMIDTSTMSDD